MKIQLIPVQQIIMSIVLTGTFFVGSHTAQAASLFCKQTLTASEPATFRKASGDLFMAYRSNAPHYWKWVTQVSHPAFLVKGTVVGDAHILNFRDTPLENTKRAFTLVDMDDAGYGSLLGDFLRYYVGNQISPFKAPSKELWKAYVDGLNKVEMEKPDLIQKLENTDYGATKQKQFIEKLASEKQFSDKAGLTDLSKAPESVAKLFNTADPHFRKELAGKEILDTGFKIPEEGGSQGLVRFWYLVREGKTQRIYEFKQETETATSQYGPQPDRAVAFHNIVELYRPSNTSDKPKMVKVGIEYFLMRERVKSELNIDVEKPTDKEIKHIKEISLYIANMMGRAQAEQREAAHALISEIQKDPQTYAVFLEQADRYISEISKLNK
jgi:Uncharacterized protein conserved in bacteria (DUF2252).